MLEATNCIDKTGSEKSPLGIKIEITGNEGFMLCLRKKSQIVFNGATAEERNLLGEFSFRKIGIIPETCDNKVLGLIGIDCISSGRKINPVELSSVSIVANALGMALERARLFEQYSIKDAFDDLTSLYNKGSINKLLAAKYEKAVAGKQGISLDMLDIDHFKQFNDSFGHMPGDTFNYFPPLCADYRSG
jgi:predicted signal transduction protein with EAL and GGDEF domain